MNRLRPTITAAGSRRLVMFVLAAGSTLLLAAIPTAVADDSKRLKEELGKLQTSKQSFETTYSSETQKLEKSFDDLAELVDGSMRIPVLDRQAIVADLRKARKEFTNRGSFAKIPAMQEHYVTFVVSLLASYQVLMRQYQQVLGLMPKDDLRRTEFNREIEDATARVSKFDSLKKGTVFSGFRKDFDWGPVKGYVESEDAIRFKRINNGRVEAEISLKVTERAGSLIQGRLHQGGFVADVAGTYDGVNLNIKVVRIGKGSPRYFEYSGKLVGQVGVLNLAGVKANGVATTGTVILERQ